MTSDLPELVQLDDGHATLAVCPAIGGSIASYTAADGTALFRPSTADDLASGSANRLACYPLVPFSNRIAHGRFSFEGTAVALPLNFAPSAHPIHGFGWQAAWQVLDHDTRAVRLAHAYDDGPWPWPYRAEQHIRLEQGALAITLSLSNTGTHAMPFGLGLHPYLPLHGGARLFARSAGFWSTDATLIPQGWCAEPGPMAGADGLDVESALLDTVFGGWDRHAVVRWPDDGVSLALSGSDLAACLVVFTPQADFFALEPVSHMTDAFNRQDDPRSGFRVLAAGAQARLDARFTPGFASIAGWSG